MFLALFEIFWENIHRMIARILGPVVSRTCVLLHFGKTTGQELKDDRYAPKKKQPRGSGIKRIYRRKMTG